jgi:hypothetical protein
MIADIPLRPCTCTNSSFLESPNHRFRGCIFGNGSTILSHTVLRYVEARQVWDETSARSCRLNMVVYIRRRVSE